MAVTGHGAEIVWLASYPKAGNTWMRLLLLHVLNPEADDWALDQPLSIASGNPIDRALVEQTCLFDATLLSPAECDRLRPILYRTAAAATESGALPAQHRFFKVHDAYRYTPDGQPVMGEHSAQRALYLVRDPRDVVLSLAAFWNRPIDYIVELMNRRGTNLAGSKRQFNPQLRQQLLDWSSHVRSWLDQRHVPVLLVRYEDLRESPGAVLARVADFLNLQVPTTQIERAVQLTAFERLQREEALRGFSEHLGRPSPFFRRAQPGEWREALSSDVVAAIESAHGPTMRRLGYRCELVCDAIL
jgi:aryl sulfotransferase